MMKINESVVAVIVPTLNAGEMWNDWMRCYNKQTFQPNIKLVIDSESGDDTPHIATKHGFKIQHIFKKKFNHGGTRDLALTLAAEADILVFLTQDALLDSPDSLKKIVEIFNDPQIGCAYGRQLPHTNAGSIATHARFFNYSDSSSKKSLADVPRLGCKAAFISNSFAAYRREALLAVGGFPSDVIFAEDACVAARMLLEDWSVSYCAEATVLHSHDYSLVEEFRRYFDVGVFHAREKWILERFGSPSGEGVRFIKSELHYLAKNAFFLIPLAMVRTAVKLVAYRLGRLEHRLPNTLKKRLSMNRRYWD